MAWCWIGDKPLSEPMLIRLTDICGIRGIWVNTLRPRQNGCNFLDDIFKCISLNETVWTSIKISLQLTIFQHWFRQWLGAGQVTSDCPNQWWLIYWCIYAWLGLNELTHWVLNKKCSAFCNHIFKSIFLRALPQLPNYLTDLISKSHKSLFCKILQR